MKFLLYITNYKHSTATLQAPFSVTLETWNPNWLYLGSSSQSLAFHYAGVGWILQQIIWDLDGQCGVATHFSTST